MTIPSTLTLFFREYDLTTHDRQIAAPLIFERTLQFGDRAELHWLLTHYPRQQIRDWVTRFGEERIPPTKWHSSNKFRCVLIWRTRN